MKTVRQLLTGITGHVKHHLAFVQEEAQGIGACREELGVGMPEVANPRT